MLALYIRISLNTVLILPDNFHYDCVENWPKLSTDYQ